MTNAKNKYAELIRAKTRRRRALGRWYGDHSPGNKAARFWWRAWGAKCVRLGWATYNDKETPHAEHHQTTRGIMGHKRNRYIDRSQPKKAPLILRLVEKAAALFVIYQVVVIISAM